jgi:hypothetical protein
MLLTADRLFADAASAVLKHHVLGMAPTAASSMFGRGPGNRSMRS